jgi:hypothetical protein
VKLETIPVGVVVERRKAQSPWIDYTWQPVQILAGAPEAAPWSVLSQDEERTLYYAGPAEIALYRTETTNYRDNLHGDNALWVVLRPTNADPPYTVFTVTADPSEGEAFTGSGNDIVDTVPMPDSIHEAIARFVEVHHVERVFIKRKRREADREAMARRVPMRKDRDE